MICYFNSDAVPVPAHILLKYWLYILYIYVYMSYKLLLQEKIFEKYLSKHTHTHTHTRARARARAQTHIYNFLKIVYIE